MTDQLFHSSVVVSRLYQVSRRLRRVCVCVYVRPRRRRSGGLRVSVAGRESERGIVMMEFTLARSVPVVLPAPAAGIFWVGEWVHEWMERKDPINHVESRMERKGAASPVPRMA